VGAIKLIIHLCLLGVLFVSTGCSSTPEEEVPTLNLSAVVIEAEPGANENNPIAVDFVFIYDKSMGQQVTGITAADWFKRRDQFKRDFPGGFRRWSWEVVPGQRIPRTQIPRQVRHDDVIASFVLARYYTSGDHRARILEETEILVKLGQQDFTLKAGQ
jgi:type VI secretion system protein